jgi:hypothetical protein
MCPPLPNKVQQRESGIPVIVTVHSTTIVLQDGRILRLRCCVHCVSAHTDGQTVCLVQTVAAFAQHCMSDAVQCIMLIALRAQYLNSYCYGTRRNVCSTLVNISQLLLEQENRVRSVCAVPKTIFRSAHRTVLVYDCMLHEACVGNSFSCQIFAFSCTSALCFTAVITASS